MLAHLLLIAALAWGVNWKHDPTALTAEAELWSATVQQAAPKPVEAPPAPPPVVTPPPPPAPPARREADIAIEREQQRLAQERRQRQQEQAERERQREEQAQRERQQREQAQRAQQERERQQAAQRRTAEEQRRRDQAQRAREDEQREARRVEQQREENLRRIAGLAGATGGPSATGSAAQASGPSDSYAGRIRARVRPNIVFTDDIAGNPVAEVEVRMSPDGTIVSRRITRSSGIRSWDDAVLRALDRTEVLPRDIDGRVHSPLLMEFRPKG